MAAQDQQNHDICLWYKLKKKKKQDGVVAKSVKKQSIFVTGKVRLDCSVKKTEVRHCCGRHTGSGVPPEGGGGLIFVRTGHQVGGAVYRHDDF